MPRAKTAPRPWSERDVAKMRALAKKRMSARLAAKALRRSPGATRFKAMVLGVSFRSINRRPVRR